MRNYAEKNKFDIELEEQRREHMLADREYYIECDNKRNERMLQKELRQNKFALKQGRQKTFRWVLCAAVFAAVVSVMSSPALVVA